MRGVTGVMRRQVQVALGHSDRVMSGERFAASQSLAMYAEIADADTTPSWSDAGATRVGVGVSRSRSKQAAPQL